MPKQILVVLGHPRVDSLCGALAQHYIDGARAAGHEVRVLRLAELRFDPILHGGYQGSQPLEPDLAAAREAITAAQHLVWVYPLWWGGMPALVKGFIDRVFLPGFAFKYRQGSPFWDRLLTGRSAEVLVTMDSPPWYFWLVNHMPGHHQMRKTILQFCGITPVRIHSFGSVKGSTPARREAWLHKALALGRAA